MEFKFIPAKQACHSDEQISITDLAHELRCGVSRVFDLIKHGYIKPIRKHKIESLYMVGRPPKAAKVWLRQILGPLPFIAMVPTVYAQELLELRERDFRQLLMEHNISIFLDPVLGELMTIAAFHGLFNAVYPWHKRSRFDRQMFFAILTGIDPGVGSSFTPPLPYSQVLENELARIARLKEPMRSIRAMDIYIAFRDAKTVEQAIRMTKKSPFREKVDTIAAGIKKRMDKTLLPPDAQSL